MGWIAVLGLIIVIIINFNIINLNKTLIKIQDKFVGYVQSVSNFLENLKIELDSGTSSERDIVQVAAPQLLFEDVRFIQRYRLLDEDAADDATMEILDLSLFERYRLVMLEIWITRTFLKETLKDVFEDEQVPPDDTLLQFVPPIGCAHANIFQYADENGALGFSADYCSEIIKLNLEDNEE